MKLVYLITAYVSLFILYTLLALAGCGIICTYIWIAKGIEEVMKDDE